VTFSVPSIKVRARAVASFDVTFSSAALPRQAVYGGYLTLTGGGSVYRVRRNALSLNRESLSDTCLFLAAETLTTFSVVLPGTIYGDEQQLPTGAHKPSAVL
jgi:hypothetical protein